MSKRPTEAQNRARARNWRIRNLRALYALAYQLTGPRRDTAHRAIDRELKSLGAEAETARMARRAAEIEAAFPEASIPF